MLKCSDSCNDNNCNDCFYIRMVAENGAKMRLRELENDKIDEWSIENIENALKRRKIRHYELGKEIEFIEQIYERAKALTTPRK